MPSRTQLSHTGDILSVAWLFKKSLCAVKHICFFSSVALFNLFFLQIMMALTVHSREPKSKRRRSQWVFDIFCLPEFFFHSLNLDFEDYVPHILFILMVVRLNEDHWIKKMSMFLKIWRVLYISFSDNSSDINLNLTEGILQSILMTRKRWRELICTSNVARGREVTWITYTMR